jgi:formin 2
VKIARTVEGTLWDELQRRGEEETEPIFDASEIQSIFSFPMPKPQVVRLIDPWRANIMEVMLAKVKVPLRDMMAALLAMDETVLDVDQIENLVKIKLFPTEEEMKSLKNYTGDKAILGYCEQFLLELMKVPRVDYKLKVFAFKIQFDTQITEFEKRLSAVNSVCEKVRSSENLKEIMKHILYLGNTLNQGTLKGSAVGFRLESLLELSKTYSPNSSMTLMHYLCKVLASKAPHLLDFYEDLEGLESASEIKMKSLAEEYFDISISLETLGMELYASERDGPVSQVFRQKLKEFIPIVETRVATVLDPYCVVGKDADALVYYFGEEPYLYPFEKVAATLLEFVNLFKKAHEENVKQA